MSTPVAGGGGGGGGGSGNPPLKNIKTYKTPLFFKHEILKSLLV